MTAGDVVTIRIGMPPTMANVEASGAVQGDWHSINGSLWVKPSGSSDDFRQLVFWHASADGQTDDGDYKTASSLNKERWSANEDGESQNLKSGDKVDYEVRIQYSDSAAKSGSLTASSGTLTID